MSWVFLILHSALGFLILYLGIAQGFIISSIFIVALMSAFHLWHSSVTRVDAIKWQEVENNNRLYWIIEGRFLLEFILIGLLPYAVFFWLLLYREEIVPGFSSGAVANNFEIINKIYAWVPMADSIRAIIINAEGQHFLNKIYLLSSCVIISLLLSTILHLILFQPFGKLHRRIDKASLTKEIALGRLLLSPLLLLALFCGFIAEMRTDFFVQMADGVTEFDETYFYSFCLFTIFVSAAFPILAVRVIQGYRRLFH